MNLERRQSDKLAVLLPVTQTYALLTATMPQQQEMSLCVCLHVIAAAPFECTQAATVDVTALPSTLADCSGGGSSPQESAAVKGEEDYQVYC